MSNKRKTRIVFVTGASAYGGAEKHQLDLVLGMDSESVENVILCCGVDPYSDRLNGCCKVHIEVQSGLRPSGFLDYRRILKRSRPDVVTFVNCYHQAFPWYAYLAARLSSARRVYAIEHLIAPPPPPPTTASGEKLRGIRALFGWRARHLCGIRLMGKLCHRTICVSHAVRNTLVSDYKYREDKTVVVWNGVDTNHFSVRRDRPSVVREELGIGPRENVLLCVARLAKEKGVDILLQAVNLVSREGVTLKCLVVGTGPLQSELDKRCAEMGLSETVLFVGFQEDVRPFYEAADLFVLSSYKEGLPIALLEAMCSGLPCIATNVGGAAEAISHGHEGWIVEPGSAEQLATAIRHALTHEEERRQMGGKAREKALKFFNVEKTMEQIRALLLS